jgi:hypothetical protein
MFHTRKFAVALVIVAALGAVSCSDDDSVTSASSMGQVKLEMGATSSGTLAATTGETDAALATLEITLESARARMTDGTWHEIPGTYPMTVDVLALAASGEVTVGAGLLPAGSYDALEVVISGASATLDDAIEINLDFPPPGRAVILAVGFEVVEGEQVFLDIHLDIDLSFKLASGSLEFEPEFEAEVEAEDD